VPLSIQLSTGLIGLPRAAIGMALAHGGMGIMVAGIIAISLWKIEVIVALKPGEAGGRRRLFRSPSSARRR
jgi:cytochrome c biogenesis factor